MGRTAPRLVFPLLALALAASLRVDARTPRPRPHAAVPAAPEASDVWVAPPVDLERALAEDEATRGSVPLRSGLVIQAGLAPDTHGTWQELAGGDRLWRIRVSSPGALWLGLGFGTWRLQEGGALTVSDPAGRVVLGPYTARHVRRHGQLHLPPVPGETALLELRWPAARADEVPNIHLGRVTHGYREWGGTGLAAPGAEAVIELGGGPSQGFCNVGVNCPLGSSFQHEKLGVIQLLTGGTPFCSGTLINNTDSDCRPLVLTARHCLYGFGPQGGPAIDPAEVTFRFNYEQPQCDSGPAPTNQLVVGSIELASWSGSDFALLELDEAVPSNFAHRFNGWDRRTEPASETWSIHHPSNAPRKISFNNDPVVTAQAGIHFGRVSEWEVGTTELGSSGAPIFDGEHRVVGQLLGGLAACDVFDFDEFGKLSGSWNGPIGGMLTQRLRDHLDPDGTGVELLDGLDPALCAAPQPRLARRSVRLIDHEDSILDPGEYATLRLELVNQGTLPATGVTGTLGTTHPQVTILDGEASWPDLGVEGAGSSTPHFRLRAEPGLVCGDSVTLQVELQSNEGTWNDQLTLQTGTLELIPRFGDDMESGSNGWTTPVNPIGPATPWAQSTARATSPTHSWFVPDPAFRIDSRLVAPTLTALPPDSVLTFSHYMNVERDFDGGLLEYSTNGTTWLDARTLITAGGYNGTVSGVDGAVLWPSGTTCGLPQPQCPGIRSAWSGDLGSFQSVEVDLGSLAGQNVTFRWRFITGFSNGDEGWYVDDVHVDRHTYTCDESEVDALARCDGSWPELPGGREMPCARPRPGPQPEGR